MHSAALHPSVVGMLGPFPPGRIEGLQINWMGVVPKGHTPGRWRLITDLSYPKVTVSTMGSRVSCVP
jgi:hypothetical protein